MGKGLGTGSVGKVGMVAKRNRLGTGSVGKVGMVAHEKLVRDRECG